jgi:hypothetical protein
MHRRQPDAKPLRRRQTGLIRQQHPLAPVGRIGFGHRLILPDAANPTHKQNPF